MNQFKKYELYIKKNGRIVDVNKSAFELCDESFELFQSLYDNNYGSIEINDNLISVHSGGWSDNEDLINCFRESFWWTRFHKASFTGGHYYFQLEGDKEWEIRPKK